MKQFIVAALAVGVATAAGSSQCLYCRNQDINAGFLVSYSYCEHQDICLKDAWNYIRRDCLTEWTRGNNLELADCNPDTVTCPGFTSSEEQFQKYTNTTWSMAAGSKCFVKIDATEGIARVIFSSTLYLGIEYEGGRVDEVMNIESGVTDLEIYNAAESGPITFGISFSGATELITSAMTVAALTMLAF